jgi:hypothetical protein
MMPLRGKLAFGFEDRAYGPNELARVVGVIRHATRSEQSFFMANR